MDRHRFDDLARAMAASGASRRTALRLLGAAAGWIAAGNGAAVVAQGEPAGGATCGTDADCVDPDADPCTGARCEAGACTFTSVLCTPGFVCCGNGQCCPDDGAPPGRCATDADCAGADAGADPCTGIRCEAGACVPYSLACAPGFACCGGACVASCAAGQSLDAACQCVGEPAGGSAGDDGSAPDPAPAGDGQPAGGAVQPIRLPNTGTPPPLSTTGFRLLPLAALAAGVAAVARRRGSVADVSRITGGTDGLTVD